MSARFEMARQFAEWLKSPVSTREQRKTELQRIYKAHVDEFYEDAVGNHLESILEDFISVMTPEHRAFLLKNREMVHSIMDEVLDNAK